MRLVCPICQAAYNIDERRLPPGGANVRCPKCRGVFALVPPAPDAAPVPVLPVPPAAVQESLVPPPPPPWTPPPEPPASEAITPEPFASPAASAEASPFEAVTEHAAEPTPSPPVTEEPPLPFAEEPLPFEEESAPALEEPPRAPAAATPIPIAAAGSEEELDFSSLDEPLQSAPATPPRIPARPAARQELGFGEVDLDAAASPAAPSVAPHTADPVLGHEEPFPFESASDGHLAFGERSLEGEPFATHPEGSEPPVDATGDVTMQEPWSEEPAPLPARRVPPPLVRGGPPAAEPPVEDSSLEELFAAPEPTRPADAAATRQLGDAATRQLGDAAAATATMVPPPALERKEPSAGETGKRPAPQWRRKITMAAAALILVVGVAGGAATFTQYGAFFHRAFGGKPNPHRPGARFLAEARQRLAEDRFTSIKSAVELTDRALRLDARDAEAQATYTYAASLLARRHGTAAAPWTRARAFLPELAKRAATDPDAAKAMIGAALVSGDRPAEAALSALEKHASTPGAADGDALLLLGDAALQRGDAAQATTYYRRLEALQPGSVRANHSLGVAAARRGDAAEARRLLEAAIGRDPQHLTTVVELASLALATGDAERAESLAREVLSDGQAAAGPRERARARTLMALLLVRGIDEHIEASLGAAERELEAAVQEDPEDLEPRLAFAQFLLDRGAIDRAVAVLGGVPAGLRGARGVALHARLLAVQGKAAEAMTAVDTALEKAPGDARLLYAKGVLANDAGKQADADRLWTDAIQRDPNAYEPHLALAQARLLRGDLEGADRELKVAAERAAGNARVLSTGADLLLARHELEGAEAGYDAALAADRSHGPAYLGLARIALEWRDPVAALTYLQRAVAVAPRLAPAQALYGEVQWKAGDLPGARKAFERAVALEPRDAASLARLGAIELLQGDRDAAVTHLGAAASLTVPTAEVRAWYGRALLAKGEPQSAIEQLKKSIELDARDPLVYLQLGQAYERLSNASDAAQAYRTAQELAPDRVEARVALGMLYAGQSRCKEALPELEKASALARSDNRIRMALADCKEKLGRHQEAVALYRRALQADPKQVGLYYKIARAQHEASGFSAALTWYEQAAREEPANAMPHYYMGFAHKERGRSAKAVAEFREYLRISPNALDRADIEREIEDLGAAGEPERP